LRVPAKSGILRAHQTYLSAVSHCRIPCGYCMSSLAERVQMCAPMVYQLGSSKVPPATARRPGRISSVQKTQVLQTGQNSF
jgi:hypothetical protein